MALHRRLSAAVAWLLLAAVAGLILASLLLHLCLALGEPYTAQLTGTSPVANLVAPLRTYLFRMALANTLWLAVGVGAGAMALGAALAAWLPWRRFPGATGLLLAAWLLPVPLAGLLWRTYFLLPPFDWLAGAETARLAVGWVLLWRLVPLAVLLWTYARGRRRRWIVPAALVYSVLVDGGTVLLLSGGEPFNASHTWASWLLLQLWVSRAWGASAVMAGGLAGTAALVAGVGLWAARDMHASSSPDLDPALGRGSRVLAWAVAGLWWLLPWWGWAEPLLPVGNGGWDEFAAAGGWRWVANGVAAVAVAGVVAAVLAWAIARNVGRRWPAVVPGAVVLAAALLPLWSVGLAYLRHGPAPWLSHWAAVAVLAGCLAAGPLAWSAHGRMASPGLFWPAAWTVLVLSHTFAWELVLAPPRQAYLAAAGVAYFLGASTTDPGPLAAGLAVCGGLALISVGIVVATLHRR